MSDDAAWWRGARQIIESSSLTEEQKGNLLGAMAGDKQAEPPDFSEEVEPERTGGIRITDVGRWTSPEYGTAEARVVLGERDGAHFFCLDLNYQTAETPLAWSAPFATQAEAKDAGSDALEEWCAPPSREEWDPSIDQGVDR